MDAISRPQRVIYRFVQSFLPAGRRDLPVNTSSAVAAFERGLTLPLGDCHLATIAASAVLRIEFEAVAHARSVSSAAASVGIRCLLPRNGSQNQSSLRGTRVADFQRSSRQSSSPMKAESLGTHPAQDGTARRHIRDQPHQLISELEEVFRRRGAVIPDRVPQTGMDPHRARRVLLEQAFPNAGAIHCHPPGVNTAIRHSRVIASAPGAIKSCVG